MGFAIKGNHGTVCKHTPQGCAKSCKESGRPSSEKGQRELVEHVGVKKRHAIGSNLNQWHVAHDGAKAARAHAKGRHEETMEPNRSGLSKRAEVRQTPYGIDQSSTRRRTDDSSGRKSPMRRKKKIKKMKYHNLYGQLLEGPRLRRAFERVKKNKGAHGSDGVSIEEFEANLEDNLTNLISEMRRKEYKPLPIRRVEIPKPNGGTRKLGIPSIRDRVVQENLREILSKIFEPIFSEHSHGFRPEKSCITALRDFFLQVREGGICIVDVDIEKCFDEIPHEPLIDAVAEEVADGSVLNLIRIILTAPIRDGYRIVKAKSGTPQGSPLSPLLANVYLAQIDRKLEAEGIRYCRYADDIRATAKDIKGARCIKERIRLELEKLGLKMSLKKTKLTYITQGANFLGYRLTVFKGKLYAVIPKNAVSEFRTKVRNITRRNSHLKCGERVKELRNYVRGWGEYYKRAQQPKLFAKLDKWIYRRIIAMYAGRWRSWLFIKYPIWYFRQRGVPSLYRMHMEHFKGPWVPRGGQYQLPFKGATSPCSA